MATFLPEEKVKQIFFDSDKVREGVIVATDVDIEQFAHNIEEYIAPLYIQKEREACIGFVQSINPEVAHELAKQRQRDDAKPRDEKPVSRIIQTQ